MTENNPRRLVEVVYDLVPEKADDRRWFRVEHQFEQVRFSTLEILQTLTKLAEWSENLSDRKLAKDCYYIIRGMYLDIQEHYATYLSYLSDTDVPERISRKEL